MGSTRILAAWIGHTDLRAMASELPADKQDRVFQAIKDRDRKTVADGPIRTLLKQETFDETHLLSNYECWINREYQKWLCGKVVIHEVHLKGPVDYASIFDVVDTELAKITEARGRTTYELSIHLSPGTPAMTAVWVLLGKSKYPARFWQTHEGKAWETPIPFDLTVDFLPEALRSADTAFHHLTLQSPGQIDGFQSIVGDSPATRLAVGRAQRAALRDVSVLLLGESGTGKELFARAIHAASSRKNRPFVALNCAALPEHLLESELFGHAKGSYTGAHQARDGAFKRAGGGVLFLDEIGECQPSIQAKLLRVLQPPPGEVPSVREFQPVGEDKSIRSDVRIIAATNRHLIDDIQTQRFRADLYYRLAAITVQLPPLRERKADVPPIAESILAQINEEFSRQEKGYKHKSLSASAKAFVKSYDWPGNVRELHNALLQAAVMAETDQLTKSDIEMAIPQGTSAVQSDLLGLPLGHGFDLEQHLSQIQSHYLQRAMSESGGVKTRAAKLLGYPNYQRLDAQLKRLGVKWEQSHGRA